MGSKQIAGLAGVVALSLVTAAQPARADSKFSYSVTGSVVSDYMFRGLSYNDESPTLQAYVELGYDIFYVGFAGTHVEYLGVYGPWEFDVYVGFRPTTGPINWDIAAQYYRYGSEDSTLSPDDLDYVEFKIAASTNLTKSLTVGLAGFYTPDQDLAVVDTKSVEGTASYAFPQVGIFTPTVSGLIGWTGADTDGFFLGEKEYTYWNAGLRLDVEKLYLDFRYWDTTIDHDLADSRFVFSAGITLP